MGWRVAEPGRYCHDDRPTGGPSPGAVPAASCISTAPPTDSVCSFILSGGDKFMVPRRGSGHSEYTVNQCLTLFSFSDFRYRTAASGISKYRPPHPPWPWCISRHTGLRIGPLFLLRVRNSLLPQSPLSPLCL